MNLAKAVYFAIYKSQDKFKYHQDICMDCANLCKVHRVVKDKNSAPCLSIFSVVIITSSRCDFEFCGYIIIPLGERLS